jgi:hypothetical protein
MKKPLAKIEWKAPEYEFHQKSTDWFWALGIITIALCVSAFFLHSFLFGLLALLAGFSLALYGARRPNIVSFSVGPRGVGIGNKIYDYENLKSFWLNYNPPYKKDLIIESKKTFMPHITVMLGDADPEKIRKYLLQFLKEEKIEESLMMLIARLLKI